MAPDLDMRRINAYNAMKEMGIDKKIVKPVLDNLLKLYDEEAWKVLIESENYSYLVDAIFEHQNKRVEEKTKTRRESQLSEEFNRPPLKRLRTHQEVQTSLGETSLKRHRLEDSDQPNNCLTEEHNNLKEIASSKASPTQERLEHYHLRTREKQRVYEHKSPETDFRDNGKELAEKTQLCFDNNVAQSGSISSQSHLKGKGLIPQKASPFVRKTIEKKRSSSVVYFKEPKVEPGIILMPKKDARSPFSNGILIEPKSEKVMTNVTEFELPITELPITMIRPPEPTLTSGEDPFPTKDCSFASEDANGLESLASQYADATTNDTGIECGVPASKDGCSFENEKDIGLESPASHNADTENASIGVSDKDKEHESEAGTDLELANLQETTPSFEIASSPLGEVKISLSYNYTLERPDFQIPSVDALLKMAEDKYLKSNKIIDPNFSLKKLMNEVCSWFVDLGTCSIKGKQENCAQDQQDKFEQDNQKNSNEHNQENNVHDKQENYARITTNLDLSMKSYICDSGFGAKGTIEKVVPELPRLMASSDLDGLNCIILPLQKVLPLCDTKEENDPDSLRSPGLVVVPFDDERPLHDVNDISKGEESVQISVVNEVSSETYPPSFHYIPRNIVYQDAYVTFSLARVGDEDCCSSCFGDCLSSSIPCACARETGGEFAYTLEGLIKEKFLDECISMNRDPQQHRHVYCDVCPLERPKKEDLPEPCNGHLVRRFIKECWSKCGCSKKCGNRVVQRGITCNLQVFLTSEGKGWGLRTLEDLPKGTFVCEYVGEVLTNNELHERNRLSNGKTRHTYPVLLDADWGSEGVLKDEEALCLDATVYGNVARFINHRCFDSNMVEVPVEVETPDHHYYHLAFFTTRKVDALEELTWDYGIDFDDYKHPVKGFRCLCGSQYCRDSKRSKRSKPRKLILK